MRILRIEYGRAISELSSPVRRPDSVYREGERQGRGEISVSEAAVVLGVTETTVLRQIRVKQLLATQACASAPWILRRADVERCLAERNRPVTPPTVDSTQLTLENP
jgi:hypothetical protein